MRIVIDCRKVRDLGIGTYIENLVAKLVEIDRRNEYVMLAFERDAARLRAIAEVRIVAAGLYSASELFQFARDVRAARADIFHTPHYVLPYFLSCPAVVTLHDIIHLLYPGDLPGLAARVYARHFIGRAVRSAAAVLTVSDTSRGDIIARFPDARSRIHRVYNGVDPIFSTNVENSPPPRPYLLCSGNDKPHKNLALLLRAYRRFSEERPGIDLVLTGFEAGARRDLPPGVTAAGRVPKERLAALYHSALALVCPSRYEGFGLPAAEAQACGTAVIASDIPVFREILDDAAVFFPVGDEGGLLAAMQRVAQDEPLRAGLRTRGPANARRFCFEKCARETLVVYESVRREQG